MSKSLDHEPTACDLILFYPTHLSGRTKVSIYTSLSHDLTNLKMVVPVTSPVLNPRGVVVNRNSFMRATM